MTTTTQPRRPTVYLDVDGVLNYDDEAAWPDTVDVRVSVVEMPGLLARYRIRHSPAMLRELTKLIDEFNVELVWSSTWCRDKAVLTELLPALGDDVLRGGRVLPWPPHQLKGDASKWKAETIMADQAANPRPYVWVDDEAVEDFSGLVKRRTVGTRSLHICPVPSLGLTPGELARVRAFLAGLPNG